MLSSSQEPRCSGTNFLRVETPEPPPGRASLGPHPPAEPDPRPGRGDARQVPRSPASAAARAPPVPAPRAKDLSHRRLGPRRSGDPVPPPGRPPRSRGNADCPAGRLDPLTASIASRPSTPEALEDGRWLLRGAQLHHLSSARKDLSGRTDPFFMLQCCNISATEGGKRPRSQTKHKNWCVTHLVVYLQSSNCLPGVFLAEAVQCLSLFFPGKKMD